MSVYVTESDNALHMRKAGSVQYSTKSCPILMVVLIKSSDHGKTYTNILPCASQMQMYNTTNSVVGILSFATATYIHAQMKHIL